MAAEALEKSALENKDKDQLLAIAQALGVSSVSRASKAVLIEKILEKTAAPTPTPAKSSARDGSGSKKDAPASQKGDGAKSSGGSSTRKEKVMLGPDGEPLAEWEIELAEHEGRISPEDAAEARESRQGDRQGDRQDDRGGDVNNVTIVVIVRAAIGTAKIATDAVDVAAVEMDAMKVRRVAIALMVKMTSRLAMTQWKCLGISTSETRVTDSFASMGICHRATIRTCL